MTGLLLVAGWERAFGDFSAPSIWAHSFYLDFVELPNLDGTLISAVITSRAITPI